MSVGEARLVGTGVNRLGTGLFFCLFPFSFSFLLNYSAVYMYTHFVKLIILISELF